MRVVEYCKIPFIYSEVWELLLADGTDLYVRFMEGQLLVSRIADNMWQPENAYITEIRLDDIGTARMQRALRRWLVWDGCIQVAVDNWQSAFDD